MINIKRASTISFQPTFGKDNFHDKLKGISSNQKIIHPDYASYIPLMSLRRMSDVIKMAVCCAKACVGPDDKDFLGGIIVGTALGSSNHTNTFREKVEASEGKLISPTSFILSTHNTMAGQISLALSCNGYNNTYSHNSLSFEHSLLDAMLHLESGVSSMLVGTSDEAHESSIELNYEVGTKLYPKTYGASFFLLGDESSTGLGVSFVDVEPVHGFKDINSVIALFLSRNNLIPNQIDKVYCACRLKETSDDVYGFFEGADIETYESITGSYLTSSSFAAHLGCDFLKYGQEVEYALIINNTLGQNLGLTLLKKN